MEYTLIGKIVKPHGIKGHVVVEGYSHAPDSILKYTRFFDIHKNPISLKFLKYLSNYAVHHHAHHYRWIASIEDVQDRNQALTYRNVDIYIRNVDLQDKNKAINNLENNEEYFYKDLEHCHVWHVPENSLEWLLRNPTDLLMQLEKTQIYLGYVLQVVNFGGGDLLEITNQENKKNTSFILFRKEFVPYIDIPNKIIITIQPLT